MTGAGRHQTTVGDRVKALEFSTDVELMVQAGDRIWKEYGIATGELPQKVVRTKTNGYLGTHKVAAYPEWFVTRMDAIITEVAEAFETANAPQGNLFNDG